MNILLKRRGGFTLAELMMSIGTGSIILAAILAAGLALERSFAAVENYSMSQGDQLRVLDYIAMDCRRATSVSVTGNVLTLTLPVYYDSTTAAPNTPTLSNGVLSYGSGTVTVNYQQSGSNFNREVILKGSGGGTISDTTKPIATNVSTFNVTPLTQLSANGKTVSCSIMFFPTFKRASGSGTWRSGASAPSNSVGINGDWYVIDPTSTDATTVGDVYFKSGGTYTRLQNIKATTVYCNTFLRNAVARY